ncbi:C-C motif chemokine 19-like isoform X3 [Scomber japonicus]|uniref:C-C motif chemokine 19-like isoform X3 n=1 Tax=Scomber japonicus TaxID=13676 RepID=UPI002304D4D1|nr:C-C motif chemokine 19-like isoform X3 [Scomber japonicus]
MAWCGDGKLLFCVLFLSCCIATLAERPMMCCTGVSRTTIERLSVADYHLQVKGHGCSIDAVIFVTRRGKELCVATDSPGLSDVMRHVDYLKKFCKEKNYRHRRCFGVKRV